MAIETIQGAHRKYFIQLYSPPLGLPSFTAKQYSCRPPVGHAHPQKAQPKKSDRENKIVKVTKLPVTIPIDAPQIIRKGEK